MSYHRYAPCPTRALRMTRAGDCSPQCFQCLYCSDHVKELPPVTERRGCNPRPPCDVCGEPSVIRECGATVAHCWEHFVRKPVDLADFVGRPRLTLVKS